MKILLLLPLFALLAIPPNSHAGDAERFLEAPEPLSLLQVRAFAAYTQSIDGAPAIDDGFGGGIGLLIPLPASVPIVSAAEIHGSWHDGGSNSDRYQLGALAIFDLVKLPAGKFDLVPYVGIGPGYGWDGDDHDLWSLDGAIGVRASFSDRLGGFLEYRLGWDVEDDDNNTGTARLGLSYRF